jgi:PAS domain S-box-containing protein
MTATGMPKPSLSRMLVWLPLPLFAAGIAVLWASDPPVSHESPYLLTALNVIFATLTSLFVAHLCARSFLATAEPGVLLLGCGVLVWGVTSGVAALSITRGANVPVTIHNLGVWICGACSLAGAAWASRSRRAVRIPGVWLAVTYSAGLAVVVLVTVATLDHRMPVFFVEGRGGTPVRQAVLGSAAAILGVTSAQLWRLDRRSPSVFLQWYSPGLALLAICLVGVWLETVLGGLLGWTSRAAQYLGGVYLLVAGVASVRDTRGWRITLAEALRASQERYAAFAAATFEGIVESDAGRIVACNDQFAQMAGRSRGELAGMAIADLVVPEDRERVTANLATNVASVVEHGMLRKDGTRIEVEARGRPAAPSTGHRYTAVRDITERKRSQERAARLTTLYAVLSRVNEAIVRIHEEHDLYRDICRIVADEGRFELVWIGEVDGRLVVPYASAGPAAAYLEEVRVETDGPLAQGPTGRAIRDGRSVTNYDFDTEPSMEPWRDVALRYGLRTSAAFPLRRHGTVIGTLTLYASERDAFDAEEVRLLDALAADLSYALDAMTQERLRAEADERLRQSEQERNVAVAVRAERQRLFDVLETLPAMICLLTPDYHVAFGNRGFRDRFGESRGCRCFEFCYGRTEPCEFCESHGVLSTGQPHFWEVAANDGAVLRVFASPFTDADGSPMILEMILDITESRRAERALRDAHEHLTERAAQLRALAKEITVSAQRERRRLARVLHDHMQQLLIAAKYRTAALGQAGDDATRQTATEIERLLDMSISEGRTLTAELSPPTLRGGDLPADLEWLARRMADRHGQTIELSLDEDLPPFAEDVRILLFESVRELLFNAVKHAQVQSLALAVRKVSDREVRVTVSDEGKGFDTTRLKRADEAGESFGLISIQERLDLLGGSLEIDSTPGRGSRFTLTVQTGLPPAAESARSPARASVLGAASAAEAGLRARGRPIRLLLADDHAVVREGLRRLLSYEPDIEVVGEATDGKEAADLAAALRPDVILMDLSMPRLDGVEATRAIRRDQPDVRVIGLSMFEDGPHAEAMRAAGAVDYLPKSGPSDKLLAAIRRARRLIQ